MACLLTAGRAINCKDTIGGIQAAYLTTSTLGDLTLGSDGEITAMAGTLVFFKYDLLGANGLDTTIVSAPENGTVFFESTLTMQLPKITKEDMKELKLLAYSRPRIVVQTRNNDLLLVGHKNGCDLSGSISSGQNFGDLTFVASEAIPPQFVVLSDAGTEADPFSGDSDITTTVGTNS